MGLWNTMTEQIGRLIQTGAGTGLTETEFFAREIAAWERSPERAEQVQGEAYFLGRHEILSRKRTVIGPAGALTEVKNLPNARVVDNQYAKMVNQKTNYLLGKPLTVNCENETFRQALKKVFNKQFGRTLKYICEDALNGGIGWLFVYYEQGELAFRRFPAYEILPFWADDAHTVLDAAARLYTQEVWDGLAKKIVKRVELFGKDGIRRFLFEGGALIPDTELGEYSPYITLPLPGGGAQGYGWQRFPLIAFKANKQEVPLLRRVKSLQDGINEILSDFENNMREDARSTIMVIKDYDGEDLGEFRQNLATYGAVKVRESGSVQTLPVEVNAENYRAILEQFKKALIENACGFDAKDERLSGAPNQMNIQSMYSDIDLDANGMETEFQAALEELLWFVRQDLKTKGLGDFDGEEAEIIFNRDILINETEAVANCAASAGVISEETIVAQHPWTSDAKQELARMKREKEAALADYAGAFPAKGGIR